MMTLRLWHYCVSSEDEHPDDVSLGKTMMTKMMVITMCTVCSPLVMQVGLKFHD